MEQLLLREKIASRDLRYHAEGARKNLAKAKAYVSEMGG